MLCDFSGMAAHLDNDRKRILLTAGSRKSKNVNLESKGSLGQFSNKNPTIL